MKALWRKIAGEGKANFLPVITMGLAWNKVAFADSQSALNPQGPLASIIADFFWAMMIVGGLIFLAVLTMLALGILKARHQSEPRPLTFTQSRNLVFLSGVVIPVLILLVYVIGSASVNRQIITGVPDDALTVEIIGHQWWWEVNYLNADGNPMARTANEIHIPVGKPVRLLLKSNDVIHSFWVPNLNGKTDMIPGKTNSSWMQADNPGVFRGQCTEFCGKQHAHMAFSVVAIAPEEFETWLATQIQPARQPRTEQQERGLQVFLTSSCMMCHSIRGTSAMAGVAPDLTHVASRKTLAAGTVENSHGALAAWILAPQASKPGTLMPATKLSNEELTDLVEYLMSLE
ncbi:MAG: cytochrome c oxidase subunit II [Nitrosomonadales bacterium]|nr:cytochrome c oxidase subunit II [Nitrosomonadales bacterium]